MDTGPVVVSQLMRAGGPGTHFGVGFFMSAWSDGSCSLARANNWKSLRLSGRAA